MMMAYLPLAVALLGVPASGDVPPPGPGLPPDVFHRSADDGRAEPILFRLLSLRDAVRIGLDRRSATVRVDPPVPAGVDAVDGPIVLAPIDPDASAWAAQADALALAREVARDYATLRRDRAIRQATQLAFDWAEDRLRAEQAELGHTTADVVEAELARDAAREVLAEASRRVERSSAALADRIGLAASEVGAIIPTTPAVAAPVVIDHAASRRAMLARQPDVAQARALAWVDQGLLRIARNQPFPVPDAAEVAACRALGRFEGAERDLAVAVAGGSGVGRDPGSGLAWVTNQGRTGRAPLANVRQCQYRLIHQRLALQATTEGAAANLDAATRAVERASSRLIAVQAEVERAERRLDAQVAFHAEGRITVDRLLEAIAQRAEVRVREADRVADLDFALVVLAEAQGTLLDDLDIRLANLPMADPPRAPSWADLGSPPPGPWSGD